MISAGQTTSVTYIPVAAGFHPLLLPPLPTAVVTPPSIPPFASVDPRSRALWMPGSGVGPGILRFASLLPSDVGGDGASSGGRVPPGAPPAGGGGSRRGDDISKLPFDALLAELRGTDASRQSQAVDRLHELFRGWEIPRAQRLTADQANTAVPQLVALFGHPNERFRICVLQVVEELLQNHGACLNLGYLTGLATELSLPHRGPVAAEHFMQVHATLARLLLRRVFEEDDGPEGFGTVEGAYAIIARDLDQRVIPPEAGRHVSTAPGHFLDPLAEPTSDRAQRVSAYRTYQHELEALGFRFRFAGVPGPHWPGILTFPHSFGVVLRRISGGESPVQRARWNEIPSTLSHDIHIRRPAYLYYCYPGGPCSFPSISVFKADRFEGGWRYSRVHAADTSDGMRVPDLNANITDIHDDGTRTPLLVMKSRDL